MFISDRLLGAPLVLASASPRRLELLRQVGLEPQVRPVEIDESRKPGEELDRFVERLAVEKVQAGLREAAVDLGDGVWAIGADTEVVLGGQALGKPRDAADARRMLRSLSGREHQVMTGVAVGRTGSDRVASLVVVTRVRVKAMSDAEIDGYVATGEPMDKAGGYGIQGVGAFMVAGISGSYTAVVGLPLFETLVLLEQA